MSATTHCGPPSLALLTDLYQLTMAQGYWKTATHSKQAVFHLFFRQPPFRGSYAIACGLGPLLDILADLKFSEDDLAYLATLTGSDSRPLFEDKFLRYLQNLALTCDVAAMPEGTVVFPQEPLLRICGPIIECQILETLLLNVINFQTLIATKAARVCQAADGDAVLEFGLRRAQGNDGAVAASRAAYIGGCAATSNVLAGKLYDIPVRGTHAHSWVMSFDSEAESFDAYASAMPNNCVFLVDTFDTIDGLRKAIETGRKLRERGYEMTGIRLDSGDLTRLSIEARQLLDDEGFPDAAIVASNDLDEYSILKLKAEGARIDVWGVGTKLATAFEQPALGGVYKLSAIRDANATDWQSKIKLSEERIKTSNPGILQVRRFEAASKFCGDCIFDVREGVSGDTMIDATDEKRRIPIPKEAQAEDLLQPVILDGNVVYDGPSIHESRQRAQNQLGMLPHRIRQLDFPDAFETGLSESLFNRKSRLIRMATTGKCER